MLFSFCHVYGRQSAFRVPAGFLLYSSFLSLGGTGPPSILLSSLWAANIHHAAATFGILLSRSRPGGNMNPQYPGSKGSSLRFVIGPKVSQAITRIKKTTERIRRVLRVIFWFRVKLYRAIRICAHQIHCPNCGR